MIKINDFDIFSDNLCTMKEASWDKTNKEYMTESDIVVIDFDKVKDKYIKKLSLPEIPKSNDALYISDDVIFFVEFKNGYMDNPKCYSVRKKIYDSTLIYTDITKQQISDMRAGIEYFLVYTDTEDNQKAIENERKEKEKNKKTHVDSSKSFDLLANELSSFNGEEYIAFGVGIFKNYCYKDVHTYTKEKFDEFLKTLLITTTITN